MANVYVYSGAGGAGTGADWANAYTTISAALTAKAAGDDFWVANDHNETTAGAVTWTSPGTLASPCRIICVARAGSVPPVAADLATTGAAAVTGANSITCSGTAYMYGMNITFGSAANTSNITFAGTTVFMDWTLDSCNLIFGGTSASSYIEFGATNADDSQRVRFKNTTVKFAATGQAFSMRLGTFIWEDTASAINVAGSIPVALFEAFSNTRDSRVIIRNVDLSYLDGTSTIFPSASYVSSMWATLENCKISSTVTIAGSPPALGSSIDCRNVTGSAINYQQSRHHYAGTLVHDATVLRTNTAGPNLSWKLTTTANPELQSPFPAFPIVTWNATTAAQVTATIEGVGDPRHFSALPTNADFWMDVVYLGSASDGQGTTKSGAPATILTAGSALTASTQAWDTGSTARANTTAYNLGDVIKVASNPDRIFICTTAGTTAGSEPAGYASAVDGGSVVDNTATFKAGWRFKQTVTLSSPFPAQTGLIYAYPKMAKASSVIYLDPYITLA